MRGGKSGAFFLCPISQQTLLPYLTARTLPHAAERALEVSADGRMKRVDIRRLPLERQSIQP